MTDPAHLPAGGFAALVPEFDVFDLEASLDFWCGALGFGVAYTRPGFAYLEREGAQVMLQRLSGEWDTGPLEYPLGRGLNVEIGVSSLTPILAALAARSWPLFRPVREVWRETGGVRTGNREVLVQDPNGYLLRFSETLKGE